MTDYALALYNWRLRNNLSLQEMSNSLNMSPGQYCEYERGTHIPRQLIASRIFDLTGIMSDGKGGVLNTENVMQSANVELKAETPIPVMPKTVAKPMKISTPNASVQLLSELVGFLNGLNVTINNPALSAYVNRITALLAKENDNEPEASEPCHAEEG